MTNELMVEMGARSGFWRNIRMPTGKDFQRFNRACLAGLKRVWPWIRRVLILALIAGVGVLLYQYGIDLLKGIEALIGAVFWLLGTLIQLVWSSVAFALLCSLAATLNLFGLVEDPVRVTFSSWLFEGVPPYGWDTFDWGRWTLEGVWVNLIGLPTTFGLGWLSYRFIRFRWERMVEQRLAPVRNGFEQEIRHLNNRLEWDVKSAFASGQKAGEAAERAIVRPALIHAYVPKMSLPAVEEGKTRIFWIEVTIKGAEVQPTRYDRIRWSDVTDPPLLILGAPVYERVNSKGPDKLAMMNVVYTLDQNPTRFP